MVDFYSAIERHNFIARAMSNELTERVSPSNYSLLLELIEEGCRMSLPLLSELPFDERDAAFRAIIAKWDADRPRPPAAK